jgi:hypothetical protein
MGSLFVVLMNNNTNHLFLMNRSDEILNAAGNYIFTDISHHKS